MIIIPKAIYRVSAIPISMAITFFERIKAYFKICMETQKTLNSQILIRNNKAGGITLPYFKLCNKVTVINIMVLAHTKRHIVQCKRIESPEMNALL